MMQPPYRHESIEELKRQIADNETYILELQLIINRLIKGEKPTCNYCELACVPVFGGTCELCDVPSVQEKRDSSSWQSDDHSKRFFKPQ